MKLQLESLDTLFFRDGRPFSMGEDTHAEGLFPPLPSTVLGAIRSLWISPQLEAPNASKETLATASEGQLKLAFLGLGVAGIPVFPAPLDLFFPEKGQLSQPMRLIDKTTIPSSPPAEVSHLFRGDSDGKIESVSSHLIDVSAMTDYINGIIPKPGFASKPIGHYVKKEAKIGIGRSNDTHLTQEGQLFRVAYNRLENKTGERLHLLVEVNGFDAATAAISDYAVMPLGGERRSVSAQSVDFNLPKPPKIKGQRFKLCLLTPGLFSSWSPIHLLEDYAGLQLIAAAIGRPISVGGWDVANQRPKPMRRAVPAGSVFLFEAINEVQANQVAKDLHGFSACAPPEDRYGFGLCFIAQPFDNQNL